MRLPDLELGVPESELHWVGNIMSRHLVELPVKFAPSPQQKLDSDPLSVMARAVRPSGDWEISSPARPVPEPAHSLAGTQPAHAPGAAPQPRQAPAPADAPAPAPVAPAPVAPAPGAAVVPQQRRPAAPARLWQAVSRWWNGY